MSGSIISAKARDFALQLGIENFSASDGWLSRFKARNGLTCKNICRESAAVDEATCEGWLSRKLKKRLATYSSDDVFNADETVLYFKLLPNKTITYKDDTCTGRKRFFPNGYTCWTENLLHKTGRFSFLSITALHIVR